MKKRFIEVSFPFTKMSELSQKEKPAVSKTLSTLHLWWARRPLTLSRAVIASCILPAPNDESESSESERKRIEDLLGRACTLKAGTGRKSPSSDLKELIEAIKKEFQDGRKLTLLDPFAGGGSIPFEARRLGLDVFASDLNPVSYLLRKVGVELIPNLWENKSEDALSEGIAEKGILKDFDKWSTWLYECVKGELEQYFDKSTLNYLWVKTCHCKSCGKEIPLLSMKISRKKGNIVNPQVVVDRAKGTFKIKISSSPPSEQRTRKDVRCPFCRIATTTLDDVKKEGKARKLGYFPICKYTENERKRRKFVPFTEEDLEHEKKAQDALEKIKSNPKWNHLIPYEQAPSSSSAVYRYGLDTFDKFYSPRQLLTIITLMKYVQLSIIEMEKENIEEERKELIVLLLSFLVDKFAAANSLLTSWASGRNHPRPLFAAPQFRMNWDYTESSPIRLNGSGSFGSMRNSIRRAIQNCMIPISGVYSDYIGTVANLKYQDESIDIVVTDPPYHDYIEYASLSDFFYVLLKRMNEKLFADVFQTPLTPKSNELILRQELSGKKKELSMEKLKGKLLKGWQEVNRVLKANGILVVMFTHRSTEAWEQLFVTLHRAEFYAVATWPVLSERVTKYTQGRANVNITLLIVCKKRNKTEQAIGDYRDVQEELRVVVYEKADAFFKQELSGADFFVVIQGPAMEIFAKYDRIEKSSGEEVDLSHFIKLSQKYVGEFVLEELFNVKTSLALDSITRFYIMWRWSYGMADVSVDNYLLFCKVNSTDEKYLEQLGIIEKIKKKELIHLNQYNERDLPWDNWKLYLKDQNVITKLHLALLLLDRSSYSSFTEFLELEGIKDSGHMVVQVARVLEMLLRPIVVDVGQSVPEHAMLQKFLDNRGVPFIDEDGVQKTLI